MAESVGDRLRKVRGTIPQPMFAARLGVDKNTIGRYERGERHPDTSFLHALAAEFGVALDWLVTGEGPMHRKTDQDLDAIESRLDTANAAQLEQARTDLLAIAGDDRLSPATRARADMLLDVRFGDQAAAERRAAVERVVSDDIRDLGRRLQASERQAAWRPPPLVRAMIKELLYSHPDIGDDEITSLLRAIRAELVPESHDPGQST